jgi:hypothetical protein
MQIYKTALVRFDDSTRELPVTALDEMRAASIMVKYFQRFGDDVLSAKSIRVTPSNGTPPFQFAIKHVIDWRKEHESEFHAPIVPPVSHIAIPAKANSVIAKLRRRKVS